MSAKELTSRPNLGWRSPWAWLAVGGGCELAILVWSLAERWLDLGGGLGGLRILLLLSGLLAAGVGIVMRPSSPLVLLSAGVVGFLVWLPEVRVVEGEVRFHVWLPIGQWDSAVQMVVFLTGVAFVAALLMAVPRVLRRVAVSLIVVFHFVGILSTVFSVQPAPWIATMYWAYVSRPYLDFMYLNNAYHFYSPDPGPPNLLWFRLEYEDGSRRWFKIPHKNQFPTAINYQRRLSMTEYTHHAMSPPPDVATRRVQLRYAMRDQYPLHPGYPDAAQFSEPNMHAKRVIENYARYVAKHDLFGDAPGKVVRVRVYRVVHEIMRGSELARSKDAQGHEVANHDHPLDLFRYRPHYLGEFDAEGKLLTPNDPMLYWLVPIIRKDPKLGWYQLDASTLEKITRHDGSEYEVYDYLKRHAGEYR